MLIFFPKGLFRKGLINHNVMDKNAIIHHTIKRYFSFCYTTYLSYITYLIKINDTNCHF